MPRSARYSARVVVPLCLCLGAFVLAQHAHAQAFQHPFQVGGQEGAVGHVSALSAWIIGEEGKFYLALSNALGSATHSALAMAGLLGLAFAYGIFHAAGPGHGKAVITSYMVSNERALRRGVIISLFAALLQGVVAIVLIAGAAFIFNATAQRMTEAAHVVEMAAYCGIILLGLMLVVRKGGALITNLGAIVRQRRAEKRAMAPELATVPAIVHAFPQPQMPAPAPPRPSMFRASTASVPGDQGNDCGPQCAHVLALDPRALEGDGFSLKSAALTVATAGARPCSGAILVMVFSLAQNILLTGIMAVMAIALGAAMTTACLAITAVYGKKFAMRIAGQQQSRRAQIFGQMIEVAAAVCVLLFGLALLLAALMGLSIMPTEHVY